MLRFKEFPPVPGQVEFVGVNFQDLAEQSEPEAAYRQLGYTVGSLLLANMQPPSPAAVFEAAHGLMVDNSKYEFADDGTLDPGPHFLYGVVDAITIKHEDVQQ